MDIEVQNMDLENSKISFEVQKLTSEDCFKTKMTLNIFWNISGLIFYNSHLILKGKR